MVGANSGYGQDDRFMLPVMTAKSAFSVLLVRKTCSRGDFGSIIVLLCDAGISWRFPGCHSFGDNGGVSEIMYALYSLNDGLDVRCSAGVGWLA